MSKYINISLPLSEIYKFERWASQIKDKTHRDLAFLIRMTAFDIQRKAMMFAPVDKGFLRSSIRPHFSPDKLTAFIVANRYYAPYQEFGTRPRAIIPADAENYGVDPTKWKVGSPKKLTNVRPNPFLLPAMRIGVRQMNRRLEKIGFKKVK